MRRDIADAVFETLTDPGEDAPDLTEIAVRDEPGNFIRHVAALSLTKSADGLIDPKLVLSWLLTHLGAGAGLTGALVPVREAGALLPQLFTAGPITAQPRRKWFWAAGSAVQGAAVAGMVAAALTLDGPPAGWAIIGLLAVLALARSVCSVSYKDVLGKTVAKTRRGTATGTASSISAGLVLVFAAVLIAGVAGRFSLVIGALGLAALFWGLAAMIFAGLEEEPRPGTLRHSNPRAALRQLTLLQSEPQLRRFVTARSLMVPTALAPPYFVILAQRAGDGGLASLGVLVLAASLASLMSSYVWGRMADRSSRRVLILSGLSGGIAIIAAVAVALLGLAGNGWAIPLVLFVLMIAYHGVRQGRSTYLVDMAGEDQRAPFTAVSNTAVGVFLLLAGALAAALAAWSVVATLCIFAVLSGAGAFVAVGLEEVEQ